MQGYAAEPAGGAFAQSRAYYGELEAWLSGEEAGQLRHADLEEQLQDRGRELLRRMHQDHLDLLAAREQRRADVTGPDGTARTRAEKGHGRAMATVFGQVTVSRIAYRAPGAPNVHPLDEALNLPAEKQSHGLRKLTAIESARGSFDDAAAAITRATGVSMGKRQAEELALRAAADVDAFYAGRRPGPAPDEHVLVLTGDGKGIVMRPDALRPATAKAAAGGRQKLATRLSPGEKHGRKRMAELACVYDCAPAPRTPDDIIAPPGREREKDRARGPRAAGKWLTASVTDDIPAVLAAAFSEAQRRDPGHRRTWIALVDGNRQQIDAITAEAAPRRAHHRPAEPGAAHPDWRGAAPQAPRSQIRGPSVGQQQRIRCRQRHYQHHDRHEPYADQRGARAAYREISPPPARRMTGGNKGHCATGRTSWTSSTLSVAAFLSLSSTSSVLARHSWPSRSRTDSASSSTSLAPTTKAIGTLRTAE